MKIGLMLIFLALFQLDYQILGIWANFLVPEMPFRIKQVYLPRETPEPTQKGKIVSDLTTTIIVMTEDEIKSGENK